MHDPEKLRRYLLQLSELGETELVLSRKPALRKTVAAEKSVTQRGVGREARREPAPEVTPPEHPAAAGGADWRETLRAAGADAPRRPTASKRGSAGAGDASPSATPPAPGISVRKDDADIFAPVPEFASLADISAAVARCTRCPLHRGAQNPVPGEGNPNAELVCVGEGPGASEDETGRPFVGAAGKLLTSILQAINLTREDVFICNVVKHRPPGNRTPLPDEVTACSPYLFRQIELVRPKVVLALGTVAAQTLLSTKLAMGKLRGSIHRFNGIPLIVTYHPAALLRNPAWKRPTWEDVQLVRRILDGNADG